MMPVLSRWKNVFHQPSSFQQEESKINILAKTPYGKFHQGFSNGKLSINPLFVGTSDGNLECTVNTSPYGRESLPPEGSPPLGEFALRPSGSSPDFTIILTLDLGTHTGWALRQQDGRIISGTQHFVSGKSANRFEGGGMRYLRFKHWLTEIKYTAGNIDAVYFEEVRRHAGVDAAHAYGGFLAHLTAWCEHHSIAYQGVPVGTIKRFITGKGNADKGAVIAAVKQRGFKPEDDNEADAIAILLWALQQGGAL